MSGLDLFPTPRHLETTGGTFALTDDRLVLLDGPNPQSLTWAMCIEPPALRRTTRRCCSGFSSARWIMRLMDTLD